MVLRILPLIAVIFVIPSSIYKPDPKIFGYSNTIISLKYVKDQNLFTIGVHVNQSEFTYIPVGSHYYEQSDYIHLVICTYSILSLVQTPGDRRNFFALSGIRINQSLKYLKGFEGDRNSVCINRDFVLTRVYCIWNGIYCINVLTKKWDNKKIFKLSLGLFAINN